MNYIRAIFLFLLFWAVLQMLLLRSTDKVPRSWNPPFFVCGARAEIWRRVQLRLNPKKVGKNWDKIPINKFEWANLPLRVYFEIEIKSHLHNWNRKRTRLLNRGRKTRGVGNNCQRVPWFSFYRAGQKCAPDWSQSCKRIETNSSLFTSQLCKVSFRILKASFAKHEFWHNKEHFFAKYETRCAWYSREFCTEETRVACFCDYLMFTVVYFNLFWVL